MAIVNVDVAIAMLVAVVVLMVAVVLMLLLWWWVLLPTLVLVMPMVWVLVPRPTLCRRRGATPPMSSRTAACAPANPWAAMIDSLVTP